VSANVSNVSAAIVAQSGWLMQIAARYESLKIRFATWVGISDWELHTQLGMIAFLATAIILRRPLSSPWPVLVTIVGEGINEYMDSVHYGSWRWADTSRDILFTLLWPIVLFLLARSGILKRS
jgi:hypothetical protein